MGGFFTDQNATIKAYVDGVGTISPVNSVSPNGTNDFLTEIGIRVMVTAYSDILVWGSSSTRSFGNPTTSINYSPISNVNVEVIREPTDMPDESLSKIRELTGSQMQPWQFCTIPNRNTGHLTATKVF